MPTISDNHRDAAALLRQLSKVPQGDAGVQGYQQGMAARILEGRVASVSDEYLAGLRVAVASAGLEPCA